MEQSKDNQNKEYFNEEIYQLIIDKIPEDTYGEFTELVYEIILRRSYTFELSKEQIIEDIDNLLKNCNKIQFSSNFKKNITFGHIVFSKKLIEINSKAFENSKDYEKMYKTLTHEIYHAISVKITENNKNYTGLEFFNESGERKGIVLNEVFNETAADMATYNKTEEDEKNYFRKTKGYPNITFIVPLLANSLGVNMKEFLKVGITSRERLLEFMLSKIPDSEKESFLENFEKIEFHLDQLKALEDMKINDMNEDDKKNLENSYIEISNFAINILYASIINDNRPLTKELQEEFEYRRDSVNTIIEKAKRNFSQKMPTGYSSKITQEVNIKTRKRLNSLIMKYNHLSRNADQIDAKEMYELRKSIKENFPKRKYETFYKFERKLIGHKGIDPFNILDHTVTDVMYPIEVEKNSYRKMIREENFDNFKQWDNLKVSQKLQDLFLRWKEKQSNIIRQDNNNENVVTPKQIAVCSQSASITTEEIKNAGAILTKTLTKSKEHEIT